MKRTQLAVRLGFTLIELLVVVGIIAILTAILIPSLAAARNQAQATKCLTNIRQWGIAAQVYVNENTGILPVPGDPRFGDNTPSYGANADGDKASKPLGYWNDSSLWINALPPLVNSKSYDQLQRDHMLGGAKLPRNGFNSLFVCPTYDRDITSGNDMDSFTNDGYFKMWGYPENYPMVATPNAKGIITSPPSAPGENQSDPNSSGARPTYFAYAWNSKFTQSMPRIKMSMLSQNFAESSVVLMMEKRVNPGELTVDVVQAYQSNTNRNPNAVTPRLKGRDCARIKGDWQRFTERHNKGGNLLFADGHASFIRYMELVMPNGGPRDYTTADFNLPGKAVWNPFGQAIEN